MLTVTVSVNSPNNPWNHSWRWVGLLDRWGTSNPTRLILAASCRLA